MSEFRARGADPKLGVTIALTIQGSIGVNTGTIFGSSPKTMAGVSGSAFGSTGSASSSWSVGTIPAFLQGSGQTFDISATGPTGKLAGGVYNVDLAGTPLPSGMTLSSAGVLNVGSALPADVSGVVFEYTEPGALPTLTLHPAPTTGTYPYMATVYPLEGVVPTGRSLISPTDPNLRSSTLSTWPDGSAQVMVVAGETLVTAGVPKPIALRVGTPQGVNRTPTDLVAIVSSVSVNFGTPATLNLTTNNHDRIWWQNPQVICARYRLAIPGKGAMEAVIDVHAFAGGRAFVEVVIENGRFDANSASPTIPTTQTYTNATVSVNGVVINGSGTNSPEGLSFPNQRNINGGGTYSNGHEAFRAWYCSGWVGGDPQIEVTHDTASMQAHPWFFRPAVQPAFSMQTEYTKSYDSYVPWATCRLRVPGMGGTGGDPQIGPLSKDQCDYIISGDKYVRRSVLATGMAQLCFTFNKRHSGTGEFNNQPPARQQYEQRGASWAVGATTEPNYGGSQNDASHCPVSPLVPFMCRPSPIFIDIAQNAKQWCYTNFGGGSWFSSFPGGFHNYDQVRSRAWRFRNYAVATFLTPDADVNRKAGYRQTLIAYTTGMNKYRNRSFNQLGVVWPDGPGPTDQTDGEMLMRGVDGQPYREAAFMMWFVVMVFNTVRRLKLLTGADQSALETVADALGQVPVRVMNDATAGEWRVQTIDYIIGRQVGTSQPISLNQLDGTFGACLRDYQTSGTIPAASGTWLSYNGGLNTNWSSYVYEAGFAGYEFADQFFCALVTAVENGVPGADAAWSKLYGTSGNGQLTNYASWASKWTNAGDNSSGQWNRFPRNK